MAAVRQSQYAVYEAVKRTPRKHAAQRESRRRGPMRTATHCPQPWVRVRRALRSRPGATMAQTELVFGQATISLPPAKRGFHIITNRVRFACSESHGDAESREGGTGRPSGEHRAGKNRRRDV